MDKPLWQPTDALLNESNMAHFIKYVCDKEHLKLTHYDELYQFSIKHPEKFWRYLAEFTEIIFSKIAKKTLATGDHMIDAKWFEGAELNFAENLLKFHDFNKPALIFLTICNF